MIHSWSSENYYASIVHVKCSITSHDWFSEHSPANRHNNVDTGLCGWYKLWQRFYDIWTGKLKFFVSILAKRGERLLQKKTKNKINMYLTHQFSGWPSNSVSEQSFLASFWRFTSEFWHIIRIYRFLCVCFRIRLLSPLTWKTFNLINNSWLVVAGQMFTWFIGCITNQWSSCCTI